MNNFIKFYSDNNISPVSQNLTDMELHFHRREGLYRTLGLTPLLFKDRDLLEVAPGSGFNSLATVSFGPKSYDLIEPNPAGFEKMISLFKEHNVESSRSRFFNTTLEDFSEKKEYDIVLCEGLLPGLSNPADLLHHLAKRVKKGGILVVTCADAISVFFESLRRYLARILVSEFISSGTSSENKSTHIVQMLSEAFESHLILLQGMSRPVEDWVWDNLLNPAAANLPGSNEFSIEQCLDFFGETFYYYGSSPVFMQNFSWYKNLPMDTKDYNRPFLESFIQQRHNFLHYKEIGKPDLDLGEKLYDLCKAFAIQVEEKDPIAPGKISKSDIEADLLPVRKVFELAKKSGLKQVEVAISEFLDLFNDGQSLTTQSISGMNDFSKAFGRGQQYLSMVKI